MAGVSWEFWRDGTAGGPRPGPRLFATSADEPRARRVSDLILLVACVFALVVLGVVARPSPAFTDAVDRLVAVVPSFLTPVWQVLSDLLFVLGVFLAVVALYRRRFHVVRDVLLVVAATIAIWLLTARITEGSWPDVWDRADRVRATAVVPLAARGAARSRRADRVAPRHRAGAAAEPLGGRARHRQRRPARRHHHPRCPGRPARRHRRRLRRSPGARLERWPARPRRRAGGPGGPRRAGHRAGRRRPPAGRPVPRPRHRRRRRVAGGQGVRPRCARLRHRVHPVAEDLVPGGGIAAATRPAAAGRARGLRHPVRRPGRRPHRDGRHRRRDRGRRRPPRPPPAWVPLPATYSDVDEPDHVRKLWQVLERLHHHGVAHGQVDTLHLLLDDDELVLVDFRGATVAASDAQRRSDEVQALVTTITLLGRTAPSPWPSRSGVARDWLPCSPTSSVPR